VDSLTKVSHFIPVKMTYTRPQLAELYMSRIVSLHGVPKRIVSDRGTQFTSKFWERLHETMDTYLNFIFCVPLTDRWADRDSESDPRGYVENLCSAIRKEFE
jgi:hypothetical protein